MSNPGVVVHEAFSIGPSLPVRIEDNLAEDVHIHIGPFRFDLTLEQLGELGEASTSLLDFYLKPFGLSVSNFDKEFLAQIAYMLVDLESADLERVAVQDLRVTIKKRFGFRKVVKLAESPVISAAHENFSNYERTFGSDQDNARKRIKRVQGIVATGEYGANGERVILFNDQMLVRDGQHRAAAIYLANPSAKIEVIRFRFRGNRHCIRRPLIIHSLQSFTLLKAKYIVLKMIRYISHLRRRIVSKVSHIRNLRSNG